MCVYIQHIQFKFSFISVETTVVSVRLQRKTNNSAWAEEMVEKENIPLASEPDWGEDVLQNQSRGWRLCCPGAVQSYEVTLTWRHWGGGGGGVWFLHLTATFTAALFTLSYHGNLSQLISCCGAETHQIFNETFFFDLLNHILKSAGKKKNFFFFQTQNNLIQNTNIFKNIKTIEIILFAR